MTINKQLVLLIISFYALASCQTLPVLPTITITPVVELPTITPQPTHTEQPTNTPKPTSTPVTPTATVPPSDMLTEYLENVRVMKTDPFDNGSEWNLSSAAVISDGVLRLMGLGGDDWRGMTYNKRFRAGEGFTVNFKFTSGSYFGMYFENNDWNTDAYQRFGMDFRKGNVESNLFIGKDSLGFTSLPGDFYPNYDTWYSFFMVAGKDGEFFALLWDPANPEKTVRYKDKVENWKETTWTFLTQANTGTVVFDDFQVIEFDGLK